MQPITEIPGLLRIENRQFSDQRGTLHKINLNEENELNFHTTEVFVTESALGTFRGMHLQWGTHSTKKVITLIRGSILWFAVDNRQGSNFGKIYWEKVTDSYKNSYFIPHGVAQGYVSLEEKTQILYQMDGAFCKDCDTGNKSLKILDLAKNAVQVHLIISDRDLMLPETCTEVRH
jgi:dTDP-4-dehydrorhamnose 3,5-epimerase